MTTPAERGAGATGAEGRSPEFTGAEGRHPHSDPRVAQSAHPGAGQATPTQWQMYRKKTPTAMRPYLSNENMAGIAHDGLHLEMGGMICRNDDRPDEKWYITQAYFETNYEPA